ncbi:hypothetical protein M8J75_016389 [Diaphorina citri]|nr:hypothetical protein M8J75_016389 [Diaphorina citri]
MGLIEKNLGFEEKLVLLPCGQRLMIRSFVSKSSLRFHPKPIKSFVMVRKTSCSTSSDTNHYRDYGTLKTGLPEENGSKLLPKIDWIFPILQEKSSSYFWYIASTITVAAVGIVSKWFLTWFNKVHCHNAKQLQSAFDSRPAHVPLLTVSNHDSCFDDPGLWVLLKNRQLCNNSKMRWSMAAHDICFTQTSHSYFFMLGKCVPVVRGAGIYQEAVDFAISKLSRGEWVHIFPEGKVNMDQTYLRFKWGIARMILESPVIPMVVPIWHLGMETVLPNEPPYYLRRGKTLTFHVGDPIDLAPILTDLRAANLSDREVRAALTQFIQDELYALKARTEDLHAAHLKEDARMRRDSTRAGESQGSDEEKRRR